MLSYGFSIKGKAHIKAGVVCQDANMHGEIAPGLYIGVAADGVGSARHSDIASGLATEKLVEYLERHIRADYGIDEKKVCLKAGFQYAEKAIEEYVQVYDRTTHEWSDVREDYFWEFQEKKKQMMGKEYRSPIRI